MQKTRTASRQPFASPTVMVGLTLLVFVVFTTRCIYAFVQAAGGKIEHVPVGGMVQVRLTLDLSLSQPCHAPFSSPPPPPPSLSFHPLGAHHLSQP